MKSYEDITERVFRRGDEILKIRQRRTAIIKRTSLAVSGMCAAVLVCFGVWKNNDIKNAMNNLPDDSHIITESDDVQETTTEFSLQTSTTEYKNNGTSLSPTITTLETVKNTDVFSSVTTSLATSLNNGLSGNTVICTTVPKQIYSVNTTKVQTELTDKTDKTMQTISDTTKIHTETTHEITQTTVSTAVQTNLTETNTTFLTETTTTPENSDDERSIYMKKLTSFFTSAVVLAASATPIIGNAEYNISESRYWPGEKAMFAKMDSGELDVDIDGNGIVDAIDGYLLNCYEYNLNSAGFNIYCENCGYFVERHKYFESGDACSVYCERCDYAFEWNLSDEENSSMYPGIKMSDEIKEHIEAIADYNEDGVIDDDDVDSWVRYFIVNRNLKVELFNPDYYVSEYILNDDNSVNALVKNQFMSNLYQHAYYLQAEYYLVDEMYENGTIDLDVNGNGQLDIDDIYKFYVYYNFYAITNDTYRLDFGRYDITDLFTFISSEEWNKCDKAYKTYRSITLNQANKDYFVGYAILCITGHIELKPEYLTEEYYKDRYGSNYLESAHYIVSSQVRDAVARLGLTPNEDAWLEFNIDDLHEFLDSYFVDIENGMRPAPDVNMDGVVDYEDYFVSNIYMEDLLNDRTADESILPADVWNNLAENCDFNGNGTSKDVYDILAIQMYVVKNAEAPDNFEEAYNEYVASLGGTSEFSIEGFSYENNVKILADFENKNIFYGDANCDEKLTIADATAIIQFLGNPDEYPLSEQGKKNADCYNPGDGVTGKDASAIQKIEANLLISLPEIESE